LTRPKNVGQMWNEASSTESAGKEDDARAKGLLIDKDTVRLPFLEGIGNLAHQSALLRPL
jgi:hypothetical protein